MSRARMLQEKDYGYRTKVIFRIMLELAGLAVTAQMMLFLPFPGLSRAARGQFLMGTALVAIIAMGVSRLYFTTRQEWRKESGMFWAYAGMILLLSVSMILS